MAPGRRRAIWMSGSFPSVLVKPWAGDESSNISIKWWKRYLNNDRRKTTPRSECDRAWKPASFIVSFLPLLRFSRREETLKIMDQCVMAEGSVPGQEFTKRPGLHSHLSTQQRQTSVKLTLKSSENSRRRKSRSPSLARLFQVFSSPWMLAVSPAAVSPSLIGAHYPPSRQDRLYLQMPLSLLFHLRVLLSYPFKYIMFLFGHVCRGVDHYICFLLFTWAFLMQVDD